MNVITILINALRRIFEESPGVWKFQSGVQIWARYDSYERARKAAEEYNFIKVEK